MRVKCLTLTNPWGVLMFPPPGGGPHKEYETRGWGVSYRGPLGIHAAKGYPTWARAFVEDNALTSRALSVRGYDPHDPSALPRGLILGLVDVLGCFCVDRPHPRYPTIKAGDVTPLERAWGDWTPGRIVWRTAYPRLFPEPIPTRGLQCLWTYDEPGLVADLPVSAVGVVTQPPDRATARQLALFP